MSSLRVVLAAELTTGDMIDLTPLLDAAVNPLTEDDRAAAGDGYATITALSAHGSFVDIGTDIVDVQVRVTDTVSLLIDKD